MGHPQCPPPYNGRTMSTDRDLRQALETAQHALKMATADADALREANARLEAELAHTQQHCLDQHSLSGATEQQEPAPTALVSRFSSIAVTGVLLWLLAWVVSLAASLLRAVGR